MLTLKEQNLLVENYIPFANKLAHLKAKQLPRRADIEELKSAAFLGLVQASRRYDPSKLNGFAAFAKWRIWGEINDCVRNLAWGKKTRKISIQQSDFDEGTPEFLSLSCEEESVETKDLCEYFLSEIKDSVVRDMVHRYYIGGEKLKDISEEHDLSIGRVSQILKKTMSDLNQQYTGMAA